MDTFSLMQEHSLDWVWYRNRTWSLKRIETVDHFGEMRDHLDRYGHEELHFFCDADLNGRFVVSIHNTVRGPALGGFRLWPYRSAYGATRDAMRLARGMTLKNAAIGLDLGGGKAVGWLDERGKSADLLRSFARFLARLEGRYVTAEDVGTTVEDMDVIDAELKPLTDKVLVVCCSEGKGGSGNPSPFTAEGIHEAIKISCKRVFSTPSLKERTVALQGLGNVGLALARRLVGDGAGLFVADIDEAKVRRVCREAKGKISCTEVSRDNIYAAPADVFSPCALGGVLNDQTIPQLKCTIVAGCANNQLEDEEKHSKMLQDRGILYAPDFVINAGGVTNAAMEYYDRVHNIPYDKEAVIGKIQEIFRNLNGIYDRAAAEGVTPYEAALEIAMERIEGAP